MPIKYQNALLEFELFFMSIGKVTEKYTILKETIMT